MSHPKDHEIAALVNRLRVIAIEFHDQQQLRERIAREVVPMFARTNQPEQVAQPTPVVADDTKLLDAIRDNSWDLRCFEMPTGAGDADIGWRVIQHHMDKPVERTVGEAFNDEPRDAIRDALAAAQKGNTP